MAPVRRSWNWTQALLVLAAACQAALAPTRALAADATRQSLQDAWWTGPMLTASAGTLPSGHWLLEPYLYTAFISGHYDSQGRRHPIARERDYGSLSYLLYGLTDRVTVGLIPLFGYHSPDAGAGSSGVGLGDQSVQAQYRLTQFHEGSAWPTISLVVAAGFPTGRHDRLGDRPADGLGTGAHTLVYSLYSQDYFWLPNGRILRARLDVGYGHSSLASLTDVSVYGTPDGFRGHAQPGDSFSVSAAGEYSLTRRWVLALDVVYQRYGSTRVFGSQPGSPGSAFLASFDERSPASTSLSLAPAVEYNVSGNLGFLAGVKIVTAGHDTGGYVLPAVAVNVVL